MVVEDFSEEVTFELNLQQGEEGGHLKIWEGMFQARGSRGVCVLQGTAGRRG